MHFPSRSIRHGDSLPFRGGSMVSTGARRDSQRLQITREEKFYSRLLSEENSPANPSFRVYYFAASVAVPFFWESQPGTPKHAVAATIPPPLAPPPCSYMSSNTTRSHAKSPKRNLIHAIFPGLLLRRRHCSLALSPSFASSSTSPGSHRRRQSSSAVSSSSSNSRDCNEQNDEGRSPTSSLCFGERLPAMAEVKKALLSMVGRRSGQRSAA